MSCTDLGFRRYQASESEYYQMDERTDEMYMTEVQTALILTMESIVRLHDEDHDYLDSCVCVDAQNFRQGREALKHVGIDFEQPDYKPEEPMKCRSCGHYPCACGADERS